MPGLDELGAQLGETVGGDAACSPAILFEDLAQGACSAGRSDRLPPVVAGKLTGDALDLDARSRLGGLQRGLVGPAFGEEALREIDAAHVQAFALVRLQTISNDEFGGAAADVDHQPAVG